MLTSSFRTLRHISRVSWILRQSFSSLGRMIPTPWIPNNYPSARRSDHVDEYKSESKGIVKVPDPYQWLEKNSSETEEWTIAQENFTRKYLDQNQHRKRLEDEIRSNTDYAKVMLISEYLTLFPFIMSRSCSSLHQVSNMMVDGTGTTTADCKLSQVPILELSLLSSSLQYHISYFHSSVSLKRQYLAQFLTRNRPWWRSFLWRKHSARHLIF